MSCALSSPGSVVEVTDQRLIIDLLQSRSHKITHPSQPPEMLLLRLRLSSYSNLKKELMNNIVDLLIKDRMQIALTWRYSPGEKCKDSTSAIQFRAK
jgi:hypothetical protein